MSTAIEHGQSSKPLEFLMISASDHITGLTGLTPTVTICKSNGTFQSPAGSVQEIGNGWYKVLPNSSDSDTLGRLLLHATAAGADPCDAEFLVVPFDLDASGTGSTPSRSIQNLTYYGSVNDGDTYWRSQMGGRNWKDSLDQEKLEALGSAAILINQLRYKGDKTAATQFLKFPRDGDTEVPLDIDFAAYEIAEKLLGGENVDYEIKNLSLQQTNYGALTTTIRAAKVVPDHLAAGIPSIVAWRYLLPYLQAARFVRRT